MGNRLGLSRPEQPDTTTSSSTTVPCTTRYADEAVVTPSAPEVPSTHVGFDGITVDTLWKNIPPRDTQVSWLFSTKKGRGSY